MHLTATRYQGCAEPEGGFDLDPQFCNEESGVFTLFALSPCSPANSGGCGLIGAFPVSDCPDPAGSP